MITIPVSDDTSVFRFALDTGRHVRVPLPGSSHTLEPGMVKTGVFPVLTYCGSFRPEIVAPKGAKSGFFGALWMPIPAKRTAYIVFRKTIVLVFCEFVKKPALNPGKRVGRDPYYRWRSEDRTHWKGRPDSQAVLALGSYCQTPHSFDSRSPRDATMKSPSVSVGDKPRSEGQNRGSFPFHHPRYDPA